MSALAFAEVTAAGNKLCPVSADPVDKNISAEYNEKSYGLCCKMCINKFKKNPEKYLQEMNGAAAAKDDHSAHQH
ncbi:MAG: YHS domain-containing protein [Candidatus Omnitrophica bacterium]|nr:YHS domain-containing protein [Candidatus Omnitrophota bacterium]